MKTFAEMLPTATAEMREFVEAYEEACLMRKCIPGGLSFGSTLIDQMRATPPAMEPVSVDGVIRETKDGFFVMLPSGHPWIGGNCVRVVKIKETT